MEVRLWGFNHQDMNMTNEAQTLTGSHSRHCAVPPSSYKIVFILLRNENLFYTPIPFLRAGLYPLRVEPFIAQP